jgi:hypothetical protein
MAKPSTNFLEIGKLVLERFERPRSVFWGNIDQ